MAEAAAMSEPRFFSDAAAWRSWLETNHDKAAEIQLGLHKVSSGKRALTYKEALDEALCFGWIDGVRRGGETTWQIRFTPRKPRSIWSAVNIRRVEELKATNRMHAAGLAAYESRDPELQKRYSHENRKNAKLAPSEEKAFRADGKAWAYFIKMPPSYRMPAVWWVVSARKDETRQKRLATLIADSAAGRKVKQLRRPGDDR